MDTYNCGLLREFLSDFFSQNPRNEVLRDRKFGVIWAECSKSFVNVNMDCLYKK